MSKSKRWPRAIAALVVGVSGAFASTCFAAPAQPAQPAKHVLMIVSDDMGYADTGATGVKDFETPNLDRIARGGMIMRQAYVTCAVCSPSRAGFLTGRYQQEFGHEHNGGGPPPFGLPTDQRIIAQHFKAAGFATGALGKWHLGEGPGQHPMDRGFDEFVGHLNGGHGYFPESDEKTDYGSKILDGREPAKWDEYLTTYLGRHAVDFVDRHAAEPFFLYLAFNAPHTPMQAREQDLAKFANIENDRRRKYAAMMTALDEAVGMVLDELEAKGIEDETVVVFFSDNGGPQGGDPSVNGSSNRPYRGGKSQYYEGGIRVPMFVKFPGAIEPGGTYDHAVSSLDMVPTLLAAVGAKAIDGTKLDGVNLLPYLTGEKDGPPHDRLYWRTGAGIALIEGDYKLVVFRRELGLPNNPERPDLSKAQLFKISDDPSEKREISQEEPERYRKMLDTWSAWDATLESALWGTWTDRKPKKDQGKE